MTILLTTLKNVNFGSGLHLDQVNAQGFSLTRRKDLFYFTEGVGSSVSNQIPSAPPGPIAVGDAPGTFTWLSGGGIELTKTANVLGQLEDIGGIWAITCTMCVLDPTLGAAGSGTNFVGMMGWETYPTRGISLYSAITSPYTPGAGSGLFILRSSQNGANGDAAHTFLNYDSQAVKIGQRYLYVMQHDGTGNIMSAFYQKDGIIRGSIAGKVNENDFIFSVPNQRPSVGFKTNLFPHGKIQVEHFGVFQNRPLTIEDIKQECKAANALATARGRPLSS